MAEDEDARATGASRVKSRGGGDVVVVMNDFVFEIVVNFRVMVFYDDFVERYEMLFLLWFMLMFYREFA